MRTNSGVMPDKINDRVGTDTERLIINAWLSLLRSYCGIRINYSIEHQQHYINATLNTVDFLYQFYDPDPVYFSLLDHAACRLEKLATADDQREMLAEYYEKAAVVFQTAADKTNQGDFYKKLWSIKAKEYINKADAVRGITSSFTHEERIMQLYQTFAENIPHAFIRNLLLDNYRRYESKYRVSEPQPDTSDGLHHRRTGNTEERVPDQPEPDLPQDGQTQRYSLANIIPTFASWLPSFHRKTVEETSEKQELLTQKP